MNPLLEGGNRQRLDYLYNQRRQMAIEHGKQDKEISDQIEELRKTCNHRREDGSSAWEYEGQDAGSGRSMYTCKICWASR